MKKPMEQVFAFYQGLYDLMWGREKFDITQARKCRDLLVTAKAGTISLPTHDFHEVTLEAFRAMYENMDAARQVIREACWRDLHYLMCHNDKVRYLFKEMLDAGGVRRQLYIRVIRKHFPADGFVTITITTSNAQELQRLLNAGRSGEEGYQPGTIEVIQEGPDIW